jgi:hypothetical protein
MGFSQDAVLIEVPLQQHICCFINVEAWNTWKLYTSNLFCIKAGPTFNKVLDSGTAQLIGLCFIGLIDV